MLVRRHRTVRDAHAPREPVARSLEAQDNDQRQRNAVGAQLDGLPTRTPTPKGPSRLIMAQAEPGRAATQQDVQRYRPDSMQQTEQNTDQHKPGRNRQYQQSRDSQEAQRSIKRQQ